MEAIIGAGPKRDRLPGWGWCRTGGSQRACTTVL